jgi:hypothetical protein
VALWCCAALWFVLAGAARPAQACTGDCDGDGEIDISEVIRGVTIALEIQPVASCPSFDRDGNGEVTIDELLAAVNAALGGCPSTPTPSPTQTTTGTPTVTRTPAVNHPPLLPADEIYRTFPGVEIGRPLAVSDPEGGPFGCEATDLPSGASFDPAANVLHWTPAADQLGPFYVPYTCTDQGQPPLSSQGRMTFKIDAPDPCSITSCDPATGCTTELPPVTEGCCAEEPTVRVAEPQTDCPGGRVLFFGRNEEGFGRLQNCDRLFVQNFAQTGARVTFRIETRCMNIDNRLRLSARMVSYRSDPGKPPTRLLFDEEQEVLFEQQADGFQRPLTYFISFQVVSEGPFFDLDGTESNLIVTATDTDGNSVTGKVRLVLGFQRLPDLPDVDPTPVP